MLHDWNHDKKMPLIRAAYDALPEGGAFIVGNMRSCSSRVVVAGAR